jgi:hypothetical protein
MKKVYIDSTYHYQLQKDPAGKGLVLIEYGTGDHPDTHDNDSYALCPGLDQRGPFEPKEGRVIAQFDEGEKVEVILGSYEAKITKTAIRVARRTGITATIKTSLGTTYERS